MIPAWYKPKKKFMQLAIAEAKRARERGDYPIGAVITRLMGRREVVIASAGNRVKTSGSSIKHVELETLKYVSSGYGRYLPDFVLYTTHEPCAMCAGACVWAKIGAVVYGVSQEDIAAYGRKRGTEDYKWRACLIPCRLVFEKGNHRIPVTGGFSPTRMPKTVQLRGSGKNAGADGVEVDVSSFCDGKAALWEAALCVSASLARRYLPLHLYGRGFGEFKAQCGLGR